LSEHKFQTASLIQRRDESRAASTDSSLVDPLKFRGRQQEMRSDDRTRGGGSVSERAKLNGECLNLIREGETVAKTYISLRGKHIRRFQRTREGKGEREREREGGKFQQ